MKYILLLIAFVLLPVPYVSAQITLTQSCYPASVIGTDSLKITTYASSFPALTLLANGVWDMSIVTDTTPVYFIYRVPAIGYEFADSNNSSILGFNYQGNVSSSITTSGILEYGVNIEKAGYNITYLTGMPMDSLSIDSQNILYSTPYIKVAFPAAYNSYWSSDYSSDLKFHISTSIPGLIYDHAPGIIRRYTTEKDSVTGWGKMRIKDASGSPSPYLSVLQVQTIITTVDSFFINGAPFSNALLTTLSLTQGKTTTTYQQNYYRQDEVTALASVTFTDATYTKPKSATTHIQRLATDAVRGVINEAGINVYPNPVAGNNVSIDVPSAIGEYSYELANANGCIMTSGLLQVNVVHNQLTLPAAITPGIYYLRVSNSGRLVCTKPLEVIK